MLPLEPMVLVLSRIVILDSIKMEILVNLIHEPVFRQSRIPGTLLRLGMLLRILGMLVSLNVMLGTQKLGMCVRRTILQPLLSNLPGKWKVKQLLSPLMELQTLME